MVLVEYMVVMKSTGWVAIVFFYHPGPEKPGTAEQMKSHFTIPQNMPGAMKCPLVFKTYSIGPAAFALLKPRVTVILVNLLRMVASTVSATDPDTYADISKKSCRKQQRDRD